MVRMQGVNRERTYSYRSREHGVAVILWTETYRLRVIMRDDAGPDNVRQGGIPILQDC